MRETEMKVLLCKTLENPETDDYLRYGSLRSEILNRERNNDN